MFARTPEPPRLGAPLSDHERQRRAEDDGHANYLPDKRRCYDLFFHHPYLSFYEVNFMG